MSRAPEGLPAVRGIVRELVPLGPLTWLRVGGPARFLFQPADLEDLATLRRELGGTWPLFPMGAASNLLVRDGGIRAVVVRLGGELARIEVEGTTLVTGAAGFSGLEFLIGIPGTIGDRKSVV